MSQRKTAPTACGTVNSGVVTQAASRAGCIRVELWCNSTTNQVEFRVSQETWGGSGISEEIAHGVLGKTLIPVDNS